MEVLLVFMLSLPFIIFLTGYSQLCFFKNKPSDPRSTCDYFLRLPPAKAGLSKAVISMEMVRELHVIWGVRRLWIKELSPEHMSIPSLFH